MRLEATLLAGPAPVLVVQLEPLLRRQVLHLAKTAWLGRTAQGLLERVQYVTKVSILVLQQAVARHATQET